MLGQNIRPTPPPPPTRPTPPSDPCPYPPPIQRIFAFSSTVVDSDANAVLKEKVRAWDPCPYPLPLTLAPTPPPPPHQVHTTALAGRRSRLDGDGAAARVTLPAVPLRTRRLGTTVVELGATLSLRFVLPPLVVLVARVAFESVLLSFAVVSRPSGASSAKSCACSYTCEPLPFRSYLPKPLPLDPWGCPSALVSREAPGLRRTRGCTRPAGCSCARGTAAPP